MLAGFVDGPGDAGPIQRMQLHLGRGDFLVRDPLQFGTNASVGLDTVAHGKGGEQC